MSRVPQATVLEQVLLHCCHHHLHHHYQQEREGSPGRQRGGTPWH